MSSMLRCCLALVLGLVALAYVIYQVKYETRALDRDIAALNKQIEQERDAIAVLRAEWSLLNRPERIERLAQKYLKLAPARPAQIVTIDSVTEADFERVRSGVAEAAEPSPSKTAKRAGKPAVAANEPAPKVPAGASWSATVVTPREAPAQ